MSDARPTVAVMRKTWLARSEAWIHAELRYGTRYPRIVLTTQTMHLNQFAWPKIFMPADLKRFSRAWLDDRLGRLLFGNEHYFERVVRREGVGLLHVHFGYDGVWALPLKERTGLPMVVAFHGGDMYEPDNLARFREDYARLFALGECFTVQGENMRRNLAAIGCPPEKIRLIHHSVDPNEWPYLDRPPIENEIRLLFCARLIPIKGLRYVLDAMKVLKDRSLPARLRVIGYYAETDPPEVDYEAHVRELGIEGCVDFLGYQPHSAFREELKSAHIFVQPSVTLRGQVLEGGHPFTIIEAESSGCPVIGTRHSDLPEAIPDGVAGFVVDERAPDQIADRVQWFHENPDQLRIIGRQARGHVERQHNAKVEAERLETLYDEILGRKRHCDA